MVEPDNIVVEYLRAIRERVDIHNDRMLELTQRVGNVDIQLSNLGVQMAQTSVRIDRIDARQDRVGRRLGLVDA